MIISSTVSLKNTKLGIKLKYLRKHKLDMYLSDNK